jgi:hypothetical protein
MTVMYWCVRDTFPYTPLHHCHVLARYKNVSLTHQYITVMYWHGTRTCPLHTTTSLSCTDTVQERIPYTLIHHCHVLARYKNVSLGTRSCTVPVHDSDVLVCKGHVLVPCQYMTVMHWCVRDTRTCPLHTNRSLSCTGTVQERVPYTLIHHCHVLARYKNVSLTHQYITPVHDSDVLVCKGHVLVPCQYMAVMYWCVRDARYKNVSLTHQYITVMYWHGTRTCHLHTNTSLSCTGTVQERVPYSKGHVFVPCQYMTVMYWCARDTFLYRAST